ncbi:MAG: dihydropteroate synthase [Actinobacteria bacterium]|nr:dihydropteroate synthase [Actinomycetota bacterium]
MIIIGEKINGTLPDVREAVEKRDADFIAKLATSQAEAGADYIDINVGTGTGNEPESMQWALEVVRNATGRPVALDSSDPAVLMKGLELCGESKPFINSASGELSKTECVLPLAAEYGCPIVALPMDESGIPDAPQARLEICHRILEVAGRWGIPERDLFFDPLVIPVSTDHRQGRVTLDTLSIIKKELPGVRTIIGLSNISFGLPKRHLLNRSLLSTAISIGLDAALIDPTDAGLRATVFAAEAVGGNDDFCRRYLMAYRKGWLR